MGFELREHTADVAVEATAPDLSSLFGAVADGLAAASCDDIPAVDDSVPTFEASVAAESREALLFDYLDQLIYERDVERVLPVENRVQIAVPPNADDSGVDAARAGNAEDWSLTATYRGLPLDRIDAREVKAVTYSEMRVERTASGWTAYVVFDV
ncbi:archease [Halobellus sp. GM3]|uniref:archease n=1 Tax=Halobellus sp. GM3 TaxID=3458410 RepID=UPI00403E18A8